MGTNFYFLDDVHIGKRSAAGLYCFNCGVTLCKEGEAQIHYGKSDWFDACPKCGVKRIEEKLENSSAGMELGFNKKVSEIKKGVATCCSFTWAFVPFHFRHTKSKFVKDEYGTRYTLKEFNQMLDSYPVHYYGSIGKEFS